MPTFNSIILYFLQENDYFSTLFFILLSFIHIYLYSMSKVDPTKLFTWIKLTDDFYLDPDGILGKGAFGEVFRGYSTKR